MQATMKTYANDDVFSITVNGDCNYYGTYSNLNAYAFNSFNYTLDYIHPVQGEGSREYTCNTLLADNRKEDILSKISSRYSVSSEIIEETRRHLYALTIYTEECAHGYLAWAENVDRHVELFGALAPFGADYGAPAVDDYNKLAPATLLTNYPTIGNTLTINFDDSFMPVFNMFDEAIEQGLIDPSSDFKRFVDDNKTIIPTDKSTHFDVYIKSYRTDYLGGYETSSVSVRWNNGLVTQSKDEDEEWNYKPENTIINFGVTTTFDRQNIKSLDSILYGELQYDVVGKRLFEVGGVSKPLEIISALVPSLITGDVFLSMNVVFNGQLSNPNDICLAQIPLNSATQDETKLRTLQGAKGSTVSIHYVTDESEIPPLDPTKDIGWGIPDLPIDDIQLFDPSDDSDLTTRPGTNSAISLLTNSYAIDETNLQNIGSVLWSDGFMDNIQLVNNSPIENIVSCKSFPFTVSVSEGTSSNIKLGNVEITSAVGVKLPHTFNPVRTIGTFTIPPKFNDGLHNYLDFAPYTSVIVHLPYLGFKELTSLTAEMLGKTITLKYIYDPITGVCTACFYYTSNNRLIEFEKFSGNIAIDIPITASNRAQVQASYVQGGINAVAQLLTGNIIGAINTGVNTLETPYHSQTSGSPSPSCDSFDEQSAYVIINRPIYHEPSTFAHEYGYPCNLTRNLGSLSGFTKCVNTDVKGIYCTENERQQIKQLLESGVYL